MLARLAEAPGHDRRDRSDYAGEIAVTERVGTNNRLLPDLDRAVILLLELGSHAQRRKVAERNERSCRVGGTKLAGVGVDLQHGSIYRRPDGEPLELRLGDPQFHARDIELPLG